MVSRRGQMRRGFLRWAAGAATAGALSAHAQTGTSSRARPQVFGNGPTRIAVLLETQSPSFGRAASALLGGIRAAQIRDGGETTLELIPLNGSEEDLRASVARLRQGTFKGALGPLTRDDVSAITSFADLPIPVLALNLPDPDRVVPSNLAFFGLGVEAEARQIGEFAFEATLRNAKASRVPLALLLGDGSPLSRRGAAAFAEAWSGKGGSAPELIDIDGPNAADWRSQLMSAKADCAFAMVSPDQLPALRQALPASIPLYGTSQLNAIQPGGMRGNTALDGIRFVDMPWHITPDLPAISAYPRQANLGHLDFQRFYALGIDAMRTLLEMLQGNLQFEFDGVTGRVRADLSRDLRIQRTGLIAEYRGGLPTVLPTP